MSVRDQERQEQELMRRVKEAERKSDKEVGERIQKQQREAELRADEVERRIEKGDVKPRPLPGMREDSVESTKSMESTESMKSIQSS
ncbi:MAG: hypothetical protein H0U65_07295 [Rubrobacter sp.]|nr:hypothetical protein [Rubrobacter sp.]